MYVWIQKHVFIYKKETLHVIYFGFIILSLRVLSLLILSPLKIDLNVIIIFIGIIQYSYFFLFFLFYVAFDNGLIYMFHKRQYYISPSVMVFIALLAKLSAILLPSLRVCYISKLFNFLIYSFTVLNKGNNLEDFTFIKPFTWLTNSFESDITFNDNDLFFYKAKIRAIYSASLLVRLFPI